jgi:hypothetical protein
MELFGVRTHTTHHASAWSPRLPPSSKHFGEAGEAGTFYGAQRALQLAPLRREDCAPARWEVFPSLDRGHSTMCASAASCTVKPSGSSK